MQICMGEDVDELGPVHMEASKPTSRDKNWARVENETPAHCLDKQPMSNIDVFVSAARMECS